MQSLDLYSYKGAQRLKLNITDLKQKKELFAMEFLRNDLTTMARNPSNPSTHLIIYQPVQLPAYLDTNLPSLNYSFETEKRVICFGTSKKWSYNHG